MERSPLFLAALASAAVPGLEPASVEALPSTPDQLFDVAFVEDTAQRRWVVRAPRTAAAAAQMDLTESLLGLLARRLPFALPMPRGFITLRSGGRAAVYPFLPGQHLDFAALPAGDGIAAELGRAIAGLHNADHRLFDEAGLPTYDADTYRTRRLSDLDRAAETGLVPAALLARWERALEDVNLWRFAPTPIHGDLTGDQVLAAFDDPEDASSGRIRAMTGWEDAKVADPADDFAALVVEATPEALDTVMEGYAHARAERPDPNLLVRARLAAELRLLSALMAALAAGRNRTAEGLTAQLQELDERVRAEAAVADDYHSMSLAPRKPRPVMAPPTRVEEDDEDDVPADAAAAPSEESGNQEPDNPDVAAAANQKSPVAVEPRVGAAEGSSAVGDRSLPEAEEVTEPGAGTEPHPGLGADAVPDAEPEALTEPAAEPDARAEPAAESDDQAGEPDAEPDAQAAEQDAEPETLTEPAAEPETLIEPAAEPEAQAERDAEPEAQPEAEVLAELAVSAEEPPDPEPVPPLEFEIDQPDDPQPRRRS